MSATPQEKKMTEENSDNSVESEKISLDISTPTQEEEALAAALDAANDAMIQRDQQNAVLDATALKEEADALKDQLLRAVAENENVRRRAERDLEEANKYAIAGFARDLLAVKENLFRATESISDDARAQNEQLKNLGDGVDMTLRELNKIFEKRSISRIQPEKGEKFDHNKHQAVSQIEDTSVATGCIVQILQAGYQLHDRLLQPAMVIVAKAPSDTDGSSASIDTKA